MQCAGFVQRKEELQSELQRFATRLQKDVVLPALEEHRRVLQCELLQPALAELRAQVHDDLAKELNSRHLVPLRIGGFPSAEVQKRAAPQMTRVRSEMGEPGHGHQKPHLSRYRSTVSDMVHAWQVRVSPRDSTNGDDDSGTDTESETHGEGVAEETGLTSGQGEAVARTFSKKETDFGGIETKYKCAQRIVEDAMSFAKRCRWRSQNFSLWIVHDSQLDYISSCMILLNAAFLAVQTDYMAKNLEMKPAHFLFTELLFSLFFAGELAIRFEACGMEMFHPNYIGWTLFDIVVVFCQIVDLCLEIWSNAIPFTNMSFLRLMRVFRLLRVLRLVRLLHILVELRTMLSSIMGSMRALFWVVVLYSVLVFTAGMFFTEVVAESRMDALRTEAAADEERAARELRGMATHAARGKPSPEEVQHELATYYGGLGTTILSLWECISGGLDWKTLFDPLMAGVSPWVAMIFLGYVIFATIAMMNVATGVFVDNAMKYAERDQDVYLAKNVISIFEKSELSAEGEITLAAWEAKMDSPELVALFKALNVDPSDTRTLFKLIDIDDSGSLCLDELIDGWVRLRGQAKSLDLALLMQETDRANQSMRSSLRSMEDSLNWVVSTLVSIVAAAPAACESKAEDMPVAEVPQAQADALPPDDQEGGGGGREFPQSGPLIAAALEDGRAADAAEGGRRTSIASSSRASVGAGSEDGRPLVGRRDGAAKRLSWDLQPQEVVAPLPIAPPAQEEHRFRAGIRPVRRSVVLPRPPRPVG